MMLATSCDSTRIKKRGSIMWRVTWQAGILCQALGSGGSTDRGDCAGGIGGIFDREVAVAAAASAATRAGDGCAGDSGGSTRGFRHVGGGLA
jgi:hypothetical protein